MTDNRTTELLPCPFCGGEAVWFSYSNGEYDVKCRNPYCLAKSSRWDTEAEAITAWNTRTHSTLTAEQVREAIESNSWAETSSIREFNDSSWQAIADELNAELGSGTCRLYYGEDDDGYDGWYCDGCGGWFQAVRRDGRLVEPKHCQECGKAVKR